MIPFSRPKSSWSRCCCWSWWCWRWWGSERTRTSSCSGTPWWPPWSGSARGWSPSWWQPLSSSTRTRRPPSACGLLRRAGSRDWDAWSCGWACRGGPPPPQSWRSPSPSPLRGCPSSAMRGSSSSLRGLGLGFRRSRVWEG